MTSDNAMTTKTEARARHLYGPKDTLTFEQEWSKQYNWATDALRHARMPGFRYIKVIAQADGTALRERLATWQESMTGAIEWLRYLTLLYEAMMFVRVNEVAPAPENQWTKIQTFHYDLFISGMEFEADTQERGRALVNEWFDRKVLAPDDHAVLETLMNAHGKWTY